MRVIASEETTAARKPDTRMVKMNHGGRTKYFIVPGGAVDDPTAEKIKDHPLVRAGEDGLFPDMATGRSRDGI
jgi:hypothetical protein